MAEINAHRIEIAYTITDARADVRKKRLTEILGFTGIEDVHIVDVYTIEGVVDGASQNRGALEAIASSLTDELTQEARIDKAHAPAHFDWAIEVGFLPGVTDNVANTARQGIEDLFRVKLRPGVDGVYTSQITFISGKSCCSLSEETVNAVAEALANPKINRIHVKSYERFKADRGMDAIVPRVRSDAKPTVDIVDILNAAKDVLAALNEKGMVAARYVKGEMCKYQNMETNPNGSLENIAAITDRTGRFIGMMPHPERALDFTNLPDWHKLNELSRRKGWDIPAEGPGLAIFRNGVAYFK